MHAERLPIFVTVIAACALGLFWLPLRALADGGLPPRWTTLALFAAPILVLLPMVIWRLLRGLPSGVRHVGTGLLAGGALALYSESLLLTDIARALILFYVTPVWSTLLEVLLLKQRLTRARAVALVLGLAGMVTILGGDTGIPLPQNLGDAMALLAGVFWACGSLRVRLSPDVSIFETVFSFFFYSAVVALVLALLPTVEGGIVSNAATSGSLLIWLLFLAAGLLVPVMWGILWGSQYIDAGRLGILLQAEVIVGIGSAALLTDERFGPVEMLGTLLVVSAGLVDVLGEEAKEPV